MGIMDKVKRLKQEYKRLLSGERWCTERGFVDLGKAFGRKAVEVEDKLIALGLEDLGTI